MKIKIVAVEEGQRIPAVKFIRCVSFLNLKEALDAVTNLDVVELRGVLKKKSTVLKKAEEAIRRGLKFEFIEEETKKEDGNNISNMTRSNIKIWTEHKVKANDDIIIVDHDNLREAIVYADSLKNNDGYVATGYVTMARIMIECPECEEAIIVETTIRED
jgi:hypothetical protein